MISRVILCVMMGGVGLNNLYLDAPKPLTPAQLQVKAKKKQVSEICKKKKKSKVVKKMCKQWGETNA